MLSSLVPAEVQVVHQPSNQCFCAKITVPFADLSGSAAMCYAGKKKKKKRGERIWPQCFIEAK